MFQIKFNMYIFTILARIYINVVKPVTDIVISWSQYRFWLTSFADLMICTFRFTDNVQRSISDTDMWFILYIYYNCTMYMCALRRIYRMIVEKSCEKTQLWLVVWNSAKMLSWDFNLSLVKHCAFFISRHWGGNSYD